MLFSLSPLLLKLELPLFLKLFYFFLNLFLFSIEVLLNFLQLIFASFLSIPLFFESNLLFFFIFELFLSSLLF